MAFNINGLRVTSASSGIGKILADTDGQGNVDFINLPSAGSDFGSVYFVAPTGNDGTAVVGDITLPWQTILAAVDQAVADALPAPLIYVFPGTYPEDSLQYNGSFFFTPGVIITGRPGYHGTTGLTGVNQGTQTFTTPGNHGAHFNVPGKKFRITGSTGNDGIYTVVSAVDSGPDTDIVVVEAIPSAVVNGRLSDGMDIFWASTSFSATYLLYGNTATDIKIYGELEVNRDHTIDNDWSGTFAGVGAGGDIYCECHSIFLDQGIGIYCQDDGKLTLNGEFFEIGTSGYCATVRDTTDTVFNFQRLTSSGSNCFFIRQGSTAGFSGTCRVEAEELRCTGGAQPLVFNNVLAGARVFVEATDINAATWAINNAGHSGGEIKIVGNIASPLGIVNTGSSGYLKFNGDIIGTADATSLNVISSGNVYINGDIYHNSTPTAIQQMINHTGGTLRLNGKIQTTTAGGFGIAKSGGTLVLDTVKIISDDESIYALAAQDIKIVHSLAVNTAVNPNITNAVAGSSLITDAAIE